jgi:ATP/maltotriose-dependent transcriptional regulator MalT
MVNLGGVVAAAGDLPRARELLEEALAALRDLGVVRDAGSCLYNLAVVARAEGRGDEAAGHAREALGIKHATGEQFELAQCLEVLAALALDGGDAAAAGRLLGAADSVRSRIGARSRAEERDGDPVAEGVRRAVGTPQAAALAAEGGSWTVEQAVAAASGGTPASPSPAPGPAPSALPPAAVRLGLTARELEVLGYLARRYADREIAEALVISHRTVTTHVSRILTKLGVEGRRQAARRAVELGLLDT